VVKMRFERPTCCIGHGTFCNQVSCSNSSAISPTESLLTSNYTTPKIAIFFFSFLNSAIYYVVYVDTPRWSTDHSNSRSLRRSSLRNMTHPHGLTLIHQGPYNEPSTIPQGLDSIPFVQPTCLHFSPGQGTTMS